MYCASSLICSWAGFISISIKNRIFFSKRYRRPFLFKWWTVLCWTWRFLCIDFDSAILFAKNSKLIDSLYLIKDNTSAPLLLYWPGPGFLLISCLHFLSVPILYKCNNYFQDGVFLGFQFYKLYVSGVGLIYLSIFESEINEKITFSSNWESRWCVIHFIFYSISNIFFTEIFKLKTSFLIIKTKNILKFFYKKLTFFLKIIVYFV